MLNVRFSDTVEVDTSGGTPAIAALVGEAPVSVPFTKGSGTETLTFSVTLGTEASASRTVLVALNGLALNGGAIRNGAGENADLRHPAFAFSVSGGQSQEPGNGLLTAWLVDDDETPGAHDGESPFTVRIAFSEDLATSLRDLVRGFSVTGGAITSVRRVDGKSDLCELGVEPSGDDDVTLVLEGGRACSVTGAPCTSDGRALSETLVVTVPGPAQEDAPAPLTAVFVDQPLNHDGAGEPFEVAVAFSEAIANSFRYVDDAASATGGQVTGARRKDGRSDRWILRVSPSGDGRVTVTIPGGGTCGPDHPAVLCTSDGRVLSDMLSTNVPGRWALSVADAEASEGTDENKSFRVKLDRGALEAITVDYETRDGTATAGADYTAKSGTLTFNVGEREKRVPVPILDDSHDDEGENFTLVLSNPSPGARIADGEATGTIRNSDAMPRAWIARVGRTVAEQVRDAVENRMRAPRAAGVEVRLAGRRVGSGPGGTAQDGAAADRAARAAAGRNPADRLRGETDPARRHGFGARSVTERELLTGSSFALTGGTRASGSYALWGRGAVSRFDGREGDLTLDGEVVSGMLGADWTRDALAAGLVVAHSRGEGGYRGETGRGSLSSTLTGIYPWGRHAVNERVSMWGLAGYGAGALTLTPQGADGNARAPIRTDLDLVMAAAGLRGVLVQATEGGGFELAVKTDAMGLRTSTAKAHGLAAAQAEVTRLRLGLEGSRPVRFEGGATLTPSLEIGARHDGGDAETGFGADIGGAIAWSDPRRGLSAELRGRGLLAHEAKGLRERGFSGALSFDPRASSRRGPKLTLSQSVGARAVGGMDALLERDTPAGLAANRAGDSDDDFAQRRFEVQLGYGLAAFGAGFTMTPEVGFGLSNAGRDYRLGWRLTPEDRHAASFELSLEARRSESADDNADPEHDIGFRLTARF